MDDNGIMVGAGGAPEAGGGQSLDEGYGKEEKIGEHVGSRSPAGMLSGGIGMPAEGTHDGQPVDGMPKSVAFSSHVLGAGEGDGIEEEAVPANASEPDAVEGEDRVPLREDRDAVIVEKGEEGMDEWSHWEIEGGPIDAKAAEDGPSCDTAGSPSKGTALSIAALCVSVLTLVVLFLSYAVWLPDAISSAMGNGTEVSLLIDDGSDEDASSTATVQHVTSGIEHSDLASLVDEVMPSMVSITTKSVTEMMSPFGLIGQEQEGAGSGVIVGIDDDELLVMTNEHVISGAESVSIVFIDGQEADGTVKSYDAEADLAIVSVKIDGMPDGTLDEIKVAVLGDSSAVKAGDYVIAIGNAYGYGESVTYGIVSATQRVLSTSSGSTMEYIQTDAAINPGNSGGALVNMAGEVIGINESKISDTSVEGMGFAIPVSDHLDLIEGLMSVETREKVSEVERGRLGITCITVSSDVSSSYGIPEGAFVNSVEAGSAADNAGIMEGDVITAFGGYPISGSTTLSERVACYRAGEEVTVTVMRNSGNGYEEIEIDVTLSASAGSADA